jgi:hypothetical protein
MSFKYSTLETSLIPLWGPKNWSILKASIWGEGQGQRRSPHLLDI